MQWSFHSGSDLRWCICFDSRSTGLYVGRDTRVQGREVIKSVGLSVERTFQVILRLWRSGTVVLEDWKYNVVVWFRR